MEDFCNTPSDIIIVTLNCMKHPDLCQTSVPYVTLGTYKDGWMMIMLLKMKMVVVMS